MRECIHLKRRHLEARNRQTDGNLRQVKFNTNINPIVELMNPIIELPHRRCNARAQCRSRLQKSKNAAFFCFAVGREAYHSSRRRPRLVSQSVLTFVVISAICFLGGVSCGVGGLGDDLRWRLKYVQLYVHPPQNTQQFLLLEQNAI